MPSRDWFAAIAEKNQVAPNTRATRATRATTAAIARNSSGSGKHHAVAQAETEGATWATPRPENGTDATVVGADTASVAHVAQALPNGATNATGPKSTDSCGFSEAVAHVAHVAHGFNDAQDWADFYEERTAIREFDGGRSRADAERLAWGELINIWHRQHGQPPDPARCVGCNELLSGRAALDVGVVSEREVAL